MIEKITEFLKGKGMLEPKIGLILGSGLGNLADEIADKIELPYEEIPGFPVSTVQGHSGSLVYGSLSDKKVIALKGRFHYYEGYTLEEVTLPVRVFHQLGVKELIVTNAAGAINEKFNVGDLVAIKDHINLAGANPLIGPNKDNFGPRFLDMTNAYSKKNRKVLKQIADSNNLELKEGTYVWFSGPSYETPAEISFSRLIGGDCVGMSTVPEVIVARHCGIEVTGISCISNMAAGLQRNLNHEEVVKITNKINEKFSLLIKELVKSL